MEGDNAVVAGALERVAEKVSEEADRARIEVVIRSVVSTFGFLRDFGYEMVGIEVSSSKLHKHRIVFVWQSERAKREVSIRYVPYDYEGLRSDTLNASIINTYYSIKNRTKDFKASRDYMSLCMYLESKCSNFDKRVLEIANYEGKFSERVEKALRAYAYYMQDVAGDIIQGNDWESGHFPRWH